jgi:site-specific DNA recombinase
MTGIYCRTSVELESSIQQQMKIGIEFCKAKEWEFKVYKDEGISGYKESTKGKKDAKTEDDDPLNRDGFTELLHDIKKKKIDRVWVLYQSRLSRNNRATMNIFYMFGKHNVEIYEKDRKLEITDPQVKMYIGIQSVVDEFERELIVGRTKRGLHHLIDEGRRSYQSFYGYRKAGRNGNGRTIWEIDDSRMNVVRFTYEMLLKGASFKSILQSLRDSHSIDMREHKSLQRKLSQITSHVEYTGFTWTVEGARIYRGIIDGSVADVSSLNESHLVKCVSYPEKLISVSDWFKLFEKYIIRKRVIDARKLKHLKTASKGLITGILECPICGQNFYNYNAGKSKRKGTPLRYYKHHAANLKSCSNKPRTYKVEKLDEIFKTFFFFNWIVFDNSKKLLDEALYKINQEITIRNEKLRKIEDDILRSDKQLKKYNRALDDAEPSEMKLYARRITEKEAELGSLEKEKNDALIELEKVNAEYQGTMREKIFTNLKQLVNDFFTECDDEERRTRLIKSIKKAVIIDNLIFIDTGFIIYSFDARMNNRFDEGLLNHLNRKANFFKANFILNPDLSGKNRNYAPDVVTKKSRTFNGRFIYDYAFNEPGIGKRYKRTAETYLLELNAGIKITEQHTNLIDFSNLNAMNFVAGKPIRGRSARRKKVISKKPTK